MSVSGTSATRLPAPHHAPAEDGLRFARTAPRHLVGHNAVSEVLITDWRRRGGHSFRLAAQWPRGHTFYTPVGGSWHDPLLAAESLRQAALLVGQTYYGAPDRHTSHIDALEVEVTPGALLLSPRPAEIRLDLDCVDVRCREGESGESIALTAEAELQRDDAFLGTGRIALRLLSPGRHRQLREDRTPAGPPPQPDPVPAAVAGRLHEHDVVLGIPEGGTPPHTWQLRIDPGHPVLFDCPTDHVPLMVLLEAARQATQAVCAPHRVLPVDLRSALHRPVELDRPCRITATRLPASDADEDPAVRVTAVQDGELAFDSLILAGLCD